MFSPSTLVREHPQIAEILNRAGWSQHRKVMIPDEYPKTLQHYGLPFRTHATTFLESLYGLRVEHDRWPGSGIPAAIEVGNTASLARICTLLALPKHAADALSLLGLSAPSVIGNTAELVFLDANGEVGCLDAQYEAVTRHSNIYHFLNWTFLGGPARPRIRRLMDDEIPAPFRAVDPM